MLQKVTLNAKSYPEIQQRMLGLNGYNEEQSLPHQLRAYTDHPEIILATYRTAVPVLATVKRYYEHFSTPIPEDGHIFANRRSSRFLNDEGYLDQHSLGEIRRLSPIIKGKQVLIIDQWKNVGHTIQLADTIAEEAGASSVHTITGQWYTSFDEEVSIWPSVGSLDILRKKHQPFMESIGTLALNHLSI